MTDPKANNQDQGLSLPSIQELESTMLYMPQAECPVFHHFGPGIYIRELHMAAGTFAVGHEQRYEHLNILLQGAVAVVKESGMEVMRAPAIFVGKPGRKVGYVLEDMIWQNIYATDERDIDKLESMFLKKSDEWEDHDQLVSQIGHLLREGDRSDYAELLRELGIDDRLVKPQTENEEDQIPMPEGYSTVAVRDSLISGKGVFLSNSVDAHEIIGPARINGKRTPLGRFTNHAKSPNAQFLKDRSGDITLVSIAPIAGCFGGNQGEEVTVNYRDALALSGVHIGGTR